MGYYVNIEDSNIKLPAKNKELAYWRMCGLNNRDELKRGGSLTEKWFSWMDKNYPETCKDVHSILLALGFDIEERDDDLVIHSYNDKSGQEGLFLEVISDLVVADKGDERPFIVWRGEDDMVWKDIYGERKVKSMVGTVVFKEDVIGV